MKQHPPCWPLLALLAAACAAPRPAVPQRAIPAATRTPVSATAPVEPAAAPAGGAPSEGRGGELDSPQSGTTPEAPAKPVPAAPGAGPTTAPAAPVDPARIPVARVGDEEISLAELLSTWVQTDSQGVRDMLERMVSSRLVALEARKKGIVVDPALVREGYAGALRELEEELRLQQPEMNLDEWISRGLGLDPLEYRARLEQDVKRRLYAERVVRTFVFSQEWADVRILVVETQQEAQAAMTRIRAGEPFARLAAEVSIDPGGRRGGKLPPVLRNKSSLSRLAFDTPVGDLAGPVLEGGRWMVIQTDGIHAPLLGDWGEIAPKIEASLKERPIEDPEYWMWKIAMQERHPVDFGPFYELVGDSTLEGPAGG